METEMNRNKTLQLANAGMIAALYVVLTWIAKLLGLASGAIQVRLSEALTIRPVFTVAAVPGLTVGRALANQLTGCAAAGVKTGRMQRASEMRTWIAPLASPMAALTMVRTT